MDFRAGTGLARLPLPFESLAIPFGTEGREKIAVLLDRFFDEITRGGFEHRPPLGVIGIKEFISCPASQDGSKLPAEIDRVLEARIDAIAAVGRMAVGGVAGDEHSTLAVSIGDRDPQFPETNMLELDVELGTCRRKQVVSKIEIILRRIGRHGSVEKPGRAEVDATEKLPVTLQIGMQHIEE